MTKYTSAAALAGLLVVLAASGCHLHSMGGGACQKGCYENIPPNVHPDATDCSPCGIFGCHSGCGEVYWREWVSDPPDCCDPCDGSCYIGHRNDCPKVILDPWLWILSIKKKHCRCAPCPYADGCYGEAMVMPDCGCESCNGGYVEESMPYAAQQQPYYQPAAQDQIARRPQQGAARIQPAGHNVQMRR